MLPDPGLGDGTGQVVLDTGYSGTKAPVTRAPCQSSKSDDIIYSEVRIIDSNQNRTKEEEFTYSNVASSNPAGHQPGPNVTDDPSSEARSKVINTAQVKERLIERLLLVSLCVLLLSVALVIGVLYGFGKLSHEESEKQLNFFRERNSSIEQLQAEKKNLTSELQRTKNTMDERERNYQTEKEKLENELKEINRSNKQLQEEKKNLSSELQILRLCNHIAAALKMKSNHCARGWKFFSGKCYYFSTDEETWTASRDACVAVGGHLVIVTSTEEQDFLKRSKPGSGAESYWIGRTDAMVEGEWRWLDGTKLSQTSRFRAGNEPDDWKGAQNAHPEGEDCAVMELSSASYGLQDVFCNEDNRKHKRVCEAKAGM
ncbi:hypothetical protein P4O66_008667 [Electrophorus voltai]|uniref:C-type lectin domain-containing protein n=1 Tax=Electrophorus voltai TaxID=2609070 RepID=A0AAD8ZF37_9TELE|nr:hypothetical protein P4O66_008667 [Electrophorus voltai]